MFGFWFRTLAVFQLGVVVVVVAVVVVVVGGGGSLFVFCHFGRVKNEWAAKEGVTISTQEKINFLTKYNKK